MKRVPVNLWDDYYDDDCVPPGQCQETHMYIEKYDDMNDKQKEEAMRLVLGLLNTLDLPGVEIEDGGNEIYFKHLTHKRRYRLIRELEDANLEWNGIPFIFYSES
jgi:hypothetical protein